MNEDKTIGLCFFLLLVIGLSCSNNRKEGEYYNPNTTQACVKTCNKSNVCVGPYSYAVRTCAKECNTANACVQVETHDPDYKSYSFSCNCNRSDLE
jgi:hypothetical protein